MSQRRKPPDPISAHSLAVRSVPQQAFTSRLRCHCRALGMRWSYTLYCHATVRRYIDAVVDSGDVCNREYHYKC